MDGNGIRTHNFFVFHQKRRTSEIWAFYGMLLFSLFSPFSGCGLPLSPPLFFCFSFSCLLFFGCRPSCEGRFLFSFTTEEKKEGRCVPFSLPFFLEEREEKTPVQGREKASQTIFLRRSSFSFFVFSLIFAFLFVFPLSFPWWIF